MKTRLVLYIPLIVLLVAVWKHAHWTVALSLTLLFVVSEVHDLALSAHLKIGKR